MLKRIATLHSLRVYFGITACICLAIAIAVPAVADAAVKLPKASKAYPLAKSEMVKRAEQDTKAELNGLWPPTSSNVVVYDKKGKVFQKKYRVFCGYVNNKFDSGIPGPDGQPVVQEFTGYYQVKTWLKGRKLKFKVQLFDGENNLKPCFNYL
jgi:hypothetical protein